MQIMERCISVAFEHKGKEYFAIVRHLVMQDKSYYKVRVMNNRLDGLLNAHGANIIAENEWSAELINDENNEALVLHNSITRRLGQQLTAESRTSPITNVKNFDLLTPY